MIFENAKTHISPSFLHIFSPIKSFIKITKQCSFIDNIFQKYILAFFLVLIVFLFFTQWMEIICIFCGVIGVAYSLFVIGKQYQVLYYKHTSTKIYMQFRFKVLWNEWMNKIFLYEREDESESARGETLRGARWITPPNCGLQRGGKESERRRRERRKEKAMMKKDLFNRVVALNRKGKDKQRHLANK